MAPSNTRVKTNHRELVEGDSPWIFQQHLESLNFMPFRFTIPGVSLPRAQPFRWTTKVLTYRHVPTDEAHHRTPLRHELEMHRPTQSHITSLGQALLPMEVITPEMILTIAFIATLHELVDITEHGASTRASFPAKAFRAKVATSRPLPLPLYASPS